MIVELRRIIGGPFQLEAVSETDFQRRLTLAYQRGNNEAMQMAEDLSADVDLSAPHLFYRRPKGTYGVDDIAVIRSMCADVPNHEPSLLLMNCGESRQVRPSMGSWVTYGLGTENQNLPGFIAMCPGDPRFMRQRGNFWIISD